MPQYLRQFLVLVEDSSSFFSKHKMVFSYFNSISWEQVPLLTSDGTRHLRVAHTYSPHGSKLPLPVDSSHSQGSGIRGVSHYTQFHRPFEKHELHLQSQEN